jgi:predicted nucleic acid-binding protein
MIVVDASLMVDALIDDGERGRLAAAALAADPHWAAPEHLQVEVTSAIRLRWLAKKITDERADRAVQTLSRLTVTYSQWGQLADRVWELRHNLTPYNAAYIALAEARGCRVLTTDQKLRNCVARRCPVDVIG